MNSKINQQILIDAEKNFFNNVAFGSNGKILSNGNNKKNEKISGQKKSNLNNNNNNKVVINAQKKNLNNNVNNNNKGKINNNNKQIINSKQIFKNNQIKNNVQPEFLLKGTQIQQNKNHLDKIDPNRLSKEGFYTTLPKNNNSLNNSKNSFYNSSLSINNNNNNNKSNNNNSHININNKKEKMLITSITNDSKKNINNNNNNNNNKNNNNNNKNINNNNNKNINNKNNKPNTLNKSMSHSLKYFNLQNLENTDLTENSFSSSKNFESIIEQQKNTQYHDIKQFLSNMNLDYLFPNFAKNKIFTNSQIENLSEKDLQKMKIPKENITLILERIDELKNIPNMNEINSDGFGTQCDININDPIVNNIEENERIQSELFKKAVEEFRKGKKTNENETNENNNETNENNKIDAKKFLFEIGNSDFLNLNKFSLFSDEKNDVNDDKDFIPELNVGKACWNCYKQIKNVFPLNFEQKFFCCEKCLNDYVNKNLIVCDYCKKNIIKFRQILFGNKKYCSMECCNEDRNKIVEEENEDDNNNNNFGNDKINKAKEIIKISNENKNVINDDVIDILDI